MKTIINNKNELQIYLQENLPIYFEATYENEQLTFKNNETFKIVLC